MEQVLIKEKKFEGRYVALEDINHPSPIADGASPDEVYEASVKKGFTDPIILYVPHHGMVHIY
jgi:hypothetical protein